MAIDIAGGCQGRKIPHRCGEAPTTARWIEKPSLDHTCVAVVRVSCREHQRGSLRDGYRRRPRDDHRHGEHSDTEHSQHPRPQTSTGTLAHGRTIPNACRSRKEVDLRTAGCGHLIRPHLGRLSSKCWPQSGDGDDDDAAWWSGVSVRLSARRTVDTETTGSAR
jgi:hypothetical protein